MLTIIFEAHGTTLDNETEKASGHFDVVLSALGEKQAQELGERYQLRLRTLVKKYSFGENGNGALVLAARLDLQDE